jgi:hypothetical protein
MVAICMGARVSLLKYELESGLKYLERIHLTYIYIIFMTKCHHFIIKKRLLSDVTNLVKVLNI